MQLRAHGRSLQSSEASDPARQGTVSVGNERAGAERAGAEHAGDEMRGRGRLNGLVRGWGGRGAVIAGALIAIGSAPVALASGGSPTAHAAGIHAKAWKSLRGGIHNPPFSSYSRTTGLFANTNGFVMRMKNEGGGGGLTSLCGSVTTGPPCLEASNRSTGLAFSFSTSGSTGGTILLSNPTGAPFTTNAHGVATGLNANYLEGKKASAFQLSSEPAADSSKLGGKAPSYYLNEGSVLFANVSSAAKIEAGRGAKSAVKTGSTFTVTFESDVSKCSYSASPAGAALSAGQLGVGPASGNAKGVDVYLPSGYTGGFDLQVDC